MFEAMHTGLEPSDPGFHTQRYREYLKTLEWRIRQVKLEKTDEEPSLAERDGLSTARLYQLASLIYVERTSNNLPTDSSKIDRWIDEGFQLLNKPGVDQWPFILFIFGCEARSDTQRKHILSLLSKSRCPARKIRLQRTEHLIRFSWLQDDLGDHGSSYMDKIDAVISISGTVPVFV